MRFVALLVPFVLAAGCEGCNFPFSVESGGRVALSLGAVDATCNATGEEVRDNGDVVTYEHTANGNDCTLHATWAGTLIDMEAIRADVEEQLTENGLDPATVSVSIVTLTPVVESVTLRDDDNDSPIDITIPGLQSYNGSISIEGDADIIAASFDGEGDPSQPTIAIKDSVALVALANSSYASQTPLPASGDATINVAVDQLTPIVDAVAPSLVIDFLLTVDGQAGFGG